MTDNLNVPVLKCSGVTKRYGPMFAINSINLELSRGKIVGLLGANGSGKTTLIKLISGMLSPTGGEILINGMHPSHETKAAVSYLPDTDYLPSWMKVKDIIAYFSDFYKDFEPQKAHSMLERLGIKPDDALKSMSKGTKEKVQLILAMSRNADLYLLDEPIGGVDPAARDYIINTIITNYRENSTVVISTHLIAEIEQVLDEVVFIANGQITLFATVDDIREKEGKSVDALFREVFKC